MLGYGRQEQAIADPEQCSGVRHFGTDAPRSQQVHIIAGAHCRDLREPGTGGSEFLDGLPIALNQVISSKIGKVVKARLPHDLQSHGLGYQPDQRSLIRCCTA
jgi:hypothetical protein